ncbi:MAG TPA: M23 family metallopeptidase [Bacillales bacterium]|nr:M23 family metallopeptidase [Bacillales bacterium]
MKKTTACLLFILIFMYPLQEIDAREPTLFKQRKHLYQKMEALTQIPWYYYAAIDQYERTLDRSKSTRLLSIDYEKNRWYGMLNPKKAEQDPRTIRLFGGIGRDGNGDGKADVNNPEDVLATLANELTKYGLGLSNLKMALWDRYERGQAVSEITNFARMYRTFGRLELDENAFPLPLSANYTIKNTFGYARAWGGRRSHEGVDIFADYGVPVKSTTYGYVETIGWNPFGGWRVGIRSLSNVYHYYAHLKGYANGLKKGKIVKPGEIIGYVGSSGYGPEGTQGKFPPHLHYGMYKDNGYREFSFDPYHYLKIWERQARTKNR